MPAPNTAPVADKQAVRVLAMAVGQREAARRLGLSENTVKSICHRAKDLQSVSETKDTRLHPSAPNAPKPAEAMAEILAEDERETRSSLSRTARRLARESENAPIALETPADVLAVARLYAVTHRIDAQEGRAVPTITLNVGFLLDCQAPAGSDGEIRDIAAEVACEGEETA